MEGGGSLDAREAAFLRVLRVNGIEVPGGRTGLYARGCRANHSCRPSARLCISDSGRLRLVALRPIEAGEEITVSYMAESDLLRPSSSRRKLLDLTWGFQCTCARCAGPDDRRTLRCPACAARGCSERGLVSFQSKPVKLGAAWAEIDGWAACSKCGAFGAGTSLAETRDLSRAESSWVLSYCRRLPAWCRGADGRARLRRLLRSSERMPSLEQLELEGDEQDDDDIELEDEEDDQEEEEEDDDLDEGEDFEPDRSEEAVAEKLAAAVSFYRELRLAAEDVSGAYPDLEAHWLSADSAGAAAEAGLLLLQLAESDPGGRLGAACKAAVQALALAPQEAASAASQRLKSVSLALGAETLSIEASQLLELQARALSLSADAPAGKEALALKRRAILDLTAVSSQWEQRALVLEDVADGEVDALLDVILQEAEPYAFCDDQHGTGPAVLCDTPLVLREFAMTCRGVFLFREGLDLRTQDFKEAVQPLLQDPSFPGEASFRSESASSGSSSCAKPSCPTAALNLRSFA
ncbi:unnamed protein product [Polarella glacialis]|uniref:SET domain-containing protein n=1 Tax=Polarella glacialis TaxID=89957 RepID=A0A813HXD0_POLGL|nr:unnamed protein product [Polarella glacialis]